MMRRGRAGRGAQCMDPTRRTLLQGGAALAASALARPVSAQPALYVRASIATLARENSPRLESFRRGVDAMMRLPTWDKRNWWFQASLFGAAPEQIAPEMRQHAGYFNKAPRRNYFFLAWNRMYLVYFERILRAVSGDRALTLPYWAFDDPNDLRVPEIFMPAADELGAGAAPAANVYARKNALARAVRHPAIDTRTAGLRPDLPRQIRDTLALPWFATENRAEANLAFGGAKGAPADDRGIGGLEAIANDVHDSLGLWAGDMGLATTAARDPLFWCHAANIDRLWTKWLNPAAGHVPPTQDLSWMHTAFTFVDENGQDVRIATAHALENQHQLVYRYDDEPVRRTPYAWPQGRPAIPPPEAPGTVIASAADIRPVGGEHRAPLKLAAPLSIEEARTGRFRLVVRDAAARDRASPYELALGVPGVASDRIGTLALFGGGSPTLTFAATAAVLQVARAPSFDPAALQVVVRRKGLADAGGREVVYDDPEPPRLGAVELIRM